MCYNLYATQTQASRAGQTINPQDVAGQPPFAAVQIEDGLA